MRTACFWMLLALTACAQEDVTCSCTCTCSDDSDAFADATCAATDEDTCCDGACDVACQDQGSGAMSSAEGTCEPAAATEG